MNLLRTILFGLAIAVSLAACQHPKHLVTQTTDRTGWVEVGKVGAIYVTHMQRVMDRAGIPAWFDARGYPYYPVSVPPEYRDQAAQVLAQRGYNASSQ